MGKALAMRAYSESDTLAHVLTSLKSAPVRLQRRIVEIAFIFAKRDSRRLAASNETCPKCTNQPHTSLLSRCV